MKRSTRGPGPWERQGVLFDPTPPSGPKEHPAAATLRGLRRRVFEAVYLAGPLGMTCDEIEIVTERAHQSVSARVHELARAGLLVNAGKRRRTRAGRLAVVFVVQGTKLRKNGAA